MAAKKLTWSLANVLRVLHSHSWNPKMENLSKKDTTY